MLKKKDFPTVFLDNNSSFFDFSLEMLDFINDGVAFSPLQAIGDVLYFGRYKPFTAVYMEFTTPHTGTSPVLTIEYFDEVLAAFTTVEQVVDETNGFTRSGFLHWKNPNIAGDTGNQWIQNTINSSERYWIKITTSLDATFTLKGMNLVFSDDNDLEREFPGITSYLPSTEISFIKYHTAARDQMVSAMRRDGKVKLEIGTNNNTGLTQPFEAWDFLEPEEVNAWSTHLALSNFWSQQSTEVDDKFERWSARHSGLASDFKDVFYLTLDRDDDGAKDVEERNLDQSSGIVVRR